MALATAAEIAARLGRALSAEETATANVLIGGVGNLIAETAGKTVTEVEALDPLPDVLNTVVVEAAVRVMLNPSGASTVMRQLGSFQHSATWAGGSGTTGLLLTPEEKRTVRRAVNGSLTSVSLVTPYSGDDDTAGDDTLEDLFG